MGQRKRSAMSPSSTKAESMSLYTKNEATLKGKGCNQRMGDQQLQLEQLRTYLKGQLKNLPGNDLIAEIQALVKANPEEFLRNSGLTQNPLENMSPAELIRFGSSLGYNTKIATQLAKQKIASAFNDDFIFGSILFGMGAIGIALLIGGAVDVARTTDPFTKTLEAGGIILDSRIHLESGCGAITVQYVVDDKTYQIHDIVTDPMLCLERETWLDEFKNQKGKIWPLVRYNPNDPKDSTLVDKTSNPLGIAFIILGGLILIIGIALFLFRMFRKKKDGMSTADASPTGA